VYWQSPVKALKGSIEPSFVSRFLYRDMTHTQISRCENLCLLHVIAGARTRTRIAKDRLMEHTRHPARPGKHSRSDCGGGGGGGSGGSGGGGGGGSGVSPSATFCHVPSLSHGSLRRERERTHCCRVY